MRLLLLLLIAFGGANLSAQTSRDPAPGSLLGGLLPGETVRELGSLPGTDQGGTVVFGRFVNVRRPGQLADMEFLIFGEDFTPGPRTILRREALSPTGVFEVTLGDQEPSGLLINSRLLSPLTTLPDVENPHARPLLERRSLAGTITDSNGRPIAGAQVLVRVSGESIPLVRTRSDVLGTFQLACPPLDNASLEVLAAGYGMRTYVLETLRFLALRDSNLELTLFRRPPAQLSIRDERGEPCPAGFVRLTDRFDSVPLVDGAAELPTGFQSRFLDFEGEIQDSDGVTHYFSEGLYVPAGVPLAVRMGGMEYDPTWEDRETAEDCVQVRVDLSFDAEIAATRGDPGLWLVHEDGWRAEGPGVHSFPAGRLVAILGTRFQGWNESIQELELEDEDVHLELAAKPELALDVQVPFSVGSTFHVQAGAHSISFEGPPTEPVFVPQGTPVTLWHETVGGEIRRRDLAPQDADGSVSMIGNTLVRAGLDLDPRAWPRATVRVELHDTTGARVPITNWYLSPQFWDLHEGKSGAHRIIPQNQTEDTGALEIFLPERMPYVLVLEPRGFETSWVQGLAPRAPETAEIHVQGRELAHLQLAGAMRRYKIQGRDEALVPDPRAFSLPAGTWDLAIERLDGRFLGARVTLREGESRKLVVR